MPWTRFSAETGLKTFNQRNQSGLCDHTRSKFPLPHHKSFKYLWYRSTSPTSFIQYLGFMCCCCCFFWSYAVFSGVMSDKTPWSQLHLPHTCRDKGEVWKWGQTCGGCFLLLSPPAPAHPTSPLFSLSHLLLPFLFPCQLFSFLQVKLISLQADWVILCLAVLLRSCFVCL